MISFRYSQVIISITIIFLASNLQVQKSFAFKLPDTGQTQSYTNTFGEDADYLINPPSYTDNGNGTITDNNTGLIWQKTDGGEMTIENARTYPSSLTLGGLSNWRLPTPHELMDINDYTKNNPALNTAYFASTAAQYWWTQDIAPDDANKIWVVNAGGGAGAHLKTETVSAGGTRKIHVRCVSGNSISQGFTDNGDGTATDAGTGLSWIKNPSSASMNWESALSYCENLTFAGKSDWRLPNIKELFSIVDVNSINPSLNKQIFSTVGPDKFWSSTTMANGTEKSWYLDMKNGIATYEVKTNQTLKVLCVRSGQNTVITTDAPEMILIPGGEYEMGDHIGFVDPKHPSDEFPLHKVKLDTFYMAKTELTNNQYLEFLNSALTQGLIEVRNNKVYAKGGNDIYCYTNAFAKYYSIGYDGTSFKISDFRAKHPMVGVMWFGATTYCNWLSSQNGLTPCYNLQTWVCDFTQNGYRLPTEAEWEYAGRGGKTNPYYNYPWGNTQDKTKANWPQSGDPYEGPGEDLYPQTTPVGFYNGKLQLKSEFNWPGTATSYQTSDGINGFGLYDMAGNVWEFVNDWYGQDYYSKSSYLNPTGPDSSFKMPDGKPYRGMRGGNWYNGYMFQGDTVNDGHSRVSNRNPSYYRGPQDPNHPYYHIGFRVARMYTATQPQNQKPNIPSKPTGLHEGILNQNMTFKTITTDPDGDSVAYYFDWGDGTNSGWSVFNKSGDEFSSNYNWKIKGTYGIKAKAKDIKGAESDWSEMLSVIIIPDTTNDVVQFENINEYSLQQNYPNPFFANTMIKFENLQNQHISITIHSGQGRLVKNLANGVYSAGIHEVLWDGKDNEGKTVHSGEYFYTIKTDDQIETKKMIIFK